MPEIDVLQLVDRLESLVNVGTRLPWSSKVLIDEQQFLDIVDQLRVAIPEEMRHAKRMNQQRSQVILQAEQEAQRIRVEAEQERERLLDESEIIREAQTRAVQIVHEAEKRVEEIRQGAVEFSNEVLSSLDAELSRTLATVRRGQETLRRVVEADGDDAARLPPGEQPDAR
ncbi:MAG: hypothetical protein HYY04_08835 [Chloroflexi bacterium]|nr:hypothetical protein [Chloroflexota bacterium]